MSFDRILPDSFTESSESDPDEDKPTLYECRHCGAKFESKPDNCSVCESEEIATYTFKADPKQEEEEAPNTEELDDQ